MNSLKPYKKTKIPFLQGKSLTKKKHHHNKKNSKKKAQRVIPLALGFWKGKKKEKFCSKVFKSKKKKRRNFT